MNYLDWLSVHVRLIWNNSVVLYCFWSLRNSLVLKRATQVHIPWLTISTLTVLCTDYLDSHLHRRHLHLMNKKKTKKQTDWLVSFLLSTCPSNSSLTNTMKCVPDITNSFAQEWESKQQMCNEVFKEMPGNLMSLCHSGRNELLCRLRHVFTWNSGRSHIFMQDWSSESSDWWLAST